MTNITRDMSKTLCEGKHVLLNAFWFLKERWTKNSVWD